MLRRLWDWLTNGVERRKLRDLEAEIERKKRVLDEKVAKGLKWADVNWAKTLPFTVKPG